MATINRPEGGFYIGVTCPACGGKLDLEENFFVLQCSHCGSVLRVVMPDTPPAYYIEPGKTPREIRFLLDRYLKEQGRPLTQADFSFERIYYPYWKIDGIRMRMQGETPKPPPPSSSTDILTTNIDYSGMFHVGRAVGSYLRESSPESFTVDNPDPTASLTPFHTSQAAGPNLSGIPFSLGMRADYIKMIPFRRSDLDDDFQYHDVIRPLYEILASIGGRKKKAEFGRPDSEYLPGKIVLLPRGSIVYFPYFICHNASRRTIIDGLSGRVVHEEPLIDEETPSAEVPDINFGELDVILHRCPVCGVDLPVTQSQVYICRNCETVVSLDKNLSLADRVFFARSKSSHPQPVFPFWVFTVSDEIVSRISRLAVINPTSDKLVVPAFRITNFKVIQKLTQHITATYLRFPSEKVESFNKNFRAVDIGLSEAVTLAEICLYSEMAIRNPRLTLDSIHIDPKDVSLFYAPFHPQNYFYIDSVIDTVTFARTAVEI